MNSARTLPPSTQPSESSQSLSELIDHIYDVHHVFLKEELPGIEASVRELADPSLSRVVSILSALRQELNSHLMKEEMVLFPLIRGLEKAEAAGSAAPPAHCGSVRNPVRVMCMEHDSATSALDELRALTNGFAAPADAGEPARRAYAKLETLDQDLRRHIYLENEVLFPRAIALEARL